jgi:hypothetical protein
VNHLGPRVTDRPDKDQSASLNRVYVRILLNQRGLNDEIQGLAHAAVLACLAASMPPKWAA